MSPGPLSITVEAGVALAIIDHPPLNLVDGAFIGGLVALLDRCEADPLTRVLVFDSADPDFLLMHGDVEGLLAAPVGQHRAVTEPNAAAVAFDRLRTSPLISIGILDGAARGGGSEFFSALDLRYGSERAVLGQPEVPMGILPGAGGTARLPHLLGRAKALEVILTGRDVDAHEAAQLGWLNAVVDRAALRAHVASVAQRIAAMPAASLAAVKRVVTLSTSDLRDALVAESDELSRLMAAGTHHDAMRRFLAAGGQTREVETQRMHVALEAMIQP